MDKTTHEVRLANWKSIIEQCQQRREGQTAKQWMMDHDISEKSYYYWLRKIRKEAYEQMSSINLPATSQEGTVTFAELPVQPQGASESFGQSFQADAIIRTGKLTIGLSNTVSPELLKQMLEAVIHVS